VRGDIIFLKYYVLNNGDKDGRTHSFILVG